MLKVVNIVMLRKNYCVRSSIKVSNCDKDEESFKEFTMCDSYKER